MFQCVWGQRTECSKLWWCMTVGPWAIGVHWAHFHVRFKPGRGGWFSGCSCGELWLPVWDLSRWANRSPKGIVSSVGGGWGQRASSSPFGCNIHWTRKPLFQLTRCCRHELASDEGRPILVWRHGSYKGIRGSFWCGIPGAKIRQMLVIYTDANEIQWDDIVFRGTRIAVQRLVCFAAIVIARYWIIQFDLTSDSVTGTWTCMTKHGSKAVGNVGRNYNDHQISNGQNCIPYLCVQCISWDPFLSVLHGSWHSMYAEI